MCAPCKIIIDNIGALAASARLFAWSVGQTDPAYGPAIYLAEIASADGHALIHGRGINVLDDAKMDKAHAWSELACHRAAVLRAKAGYPSRATAQDDKAFTEKYDDMPALLMKWAEEDRLFATDLVGGEYDSSVGAYNVNGVDGIALK